VFRISDAHWLAFEKEQLRRFVTGQLARLQSTYPDAIASRFGNDPSMFDKTIRNTIDKAETFGIVGEDDVAFYLDCLFEIGADFPKAGGWPFQILCRRDLDGETKMDLIWDRLHPETRVEMPG
jgi:hypothetical protein